MISKNELKNFWPFYVHSLVFNLSKVIMPFYVLYFLGVGFSFFQIALIGSIRSVVSIAFEVPTGVIADRYGRKFSVILGYLLTAISLFLVPFFRDFGIVAAIFALDALFETFVSGADRAWAVDLAQKQDSSLIDQYFLKSRFFRNIGMVAAPIIAGYIANRFGMKFLWPVFAVGCSIATIFLFFGKEIREVKDKISSSVKEGVKDFWSSSKITIKFAFGHRILLLLLSGIFIFYFIDEITSLVWTPYLQKTGINLQTIGFLFSAVSAAGIFAPIIAGVLLKRSSKFSILFFCGLCYSALLFVAGSFGNKILAGLIFVLFSSVDEIFLPLEEALTNNFIESKNRAAVLSVKSMVESFSSIIGAPIAGFVLGVVTMRQAFILAGVLFIILPIIYFSARTKNLQIKSGQS
jgi:MFS family permease